MNRICPSEETLSEYISGITPPEEKPYIEKHLCACAKCRRLLIEVHEVLNRPLIGKILNGIRKLCAKNGWLTGAMVSLACSFLFPKYFLQFLAACLLMGGKWIVDAKTAKTLIMIHEAWKRGDRNKAEKFLSRFDSEK